MCFLMLPNVCHKHYKYIQYHHGQVCFWKPVPETQYIHQSHSLYCQMFYCVLIIFVVTACTSNTELNNIVSKEFLSHCLHMLPWHCSMLAPSIFYITIAVVIINLKCNNLFFIDCPHATYTCIFFA